MGEGLASPAVINRSQATGASTPMSESRPAPARRPLSWRMFFRSAGSARRSNVIKRPHRSDDQSKPPNRPQAAGRRNIHFGCQLKNQPPSEAGQTITPKQRRRSGRRGQRAAGRVLPRHVTKAPASPEPAARKRGRFPRKPWMPGQCRPAASPSCIDPSTPAPSTATACGRACQRLRLARSACCCPGLVSMRRPGPGRATRHIIGDRSRATFTLDDRVSRSVRWCRAISCGGRRPGTPR